MGRKRQKVLIIKVGYSETLDPEIDNVTSYGDVLRTTVLLHLYRDDHVTWLVDERAYPVLKRNPYIDRVLIYDLTSVLQLESEHFDTVINLEKVPGLCALADRVTAWRRYGFRFDVKTGEAEAYEGTQDVLALCQEERRTQRQESWQATLYEMVGAVWQGQEYVLGYVPRSEAVYDIGFNHQVGHKWPSKAWPQSHWRALEGLIGSRWTVSWQQGLEDMEAYFEWIAKCRLLVTNDSFGLHLALAMKKKVVALYSSTPWRQTYLYGRGVALTGAEGACPYMPCHAAQCRLGRKCCDATPGQVYEAICRLMEEREPAMRPQRIGPARLRGARLHGVGSAVRGAEGVIQAPTMVAADGACSGG